MIVIHAFASTKGTGLRAFTGDADGHKLPERHGPWKHTGRILPNRELPFRADRSVVEAAIETQGFQMWRPGRTAT